MKQDLAARTAGALLWALLIHVAAAADFKTSNPLKAFIYEEYPRGDDYFINGNQDTYVFRCVLAAELEPFAGVALSCQ